MRSIYRVPVDTLCRQFKPLLIEFATCVDMPTIGHVPVMTPLTGLRKELHKSIMIGLQNGPAKWASNHVFGSRIRPIHDPCGYG